MVERPSKLGIAKPALSLLVTVCLLALAGPTAGASSAEEHGLAPATLDDEVPCVKYSTDPPNVEVGDCVPDPRHDPVPEEPPCVKYSTDPPNVEIGDCVPVP